MAVPTIKIRALSVYHNFDYSSNSYYMSGKNDYFHIIINR